LFGFKKGYLADLCTVLPKLVYLLVARPSPAYLVYEQGYFRSTLHCGALFRSHRILRFARRAMPLPRAINLALSGKTRWLLVPRENQPHQVQLPDPSIEKFGQLVNHRISSSTHDSRQEINTYKACGIQIYMYARWDQYTTLIQVQLKYSQVRKCCYHRRASKPGPP